MVVCHSSSWIPRQEQKEKSRRQELVSPAFTWEQMTPTVVVMEDGKPIQPHSSETDFHPGAEVPVRPQLSFPAEGAIKTWPFLLIVSLFSLSW